MGILNHHMSKSNFFYSSNFWILRHFLFWLFFYIDESLSLIGLTEPLENYGDMAVSIGLDMIMVYFNLYFLIPKFFNKNKISTYIILTGISILMNIILVNTLNYYPGEYEDSSEFMYTIIYSIIYTSGILGLAIAIKISKINFTKQEELRKLEEMKHTVEVDNLKKQINPHFLFNVLNNMYVQSKANPEEVPDTILRLSDLMRYQTYDASKEAVSLHKEIEFLRQYADLELMRRENLDINIIQEGDIASVQIAPLLFLPFFENACKHSASSQNKNAWIKASWKKNGNKIHFLCQNSVGDRSGFINDSEYSGFGLENVKRRLQLLFPDKHNLDISEQTDTFDIRLELQL